METDPIRFRSSFGVDVSLSGFTVFSVKGLWTEGLGKGRREF